jgi:hypothetical protein
LISMRSLLGGDRPLEDLPAPEVDVVRDDRPGEKQGEREERQEEGSAGHVGLSAGPRSGPAERIRIRFYALPLETGNDDSYPCRLPTAASAARRGRNSSTPPRLRHNARKLGYPHRQRWQPLRLFSEQREDGWGTGYESFRACCPSRRSMSRKVRV